MARQYWKPGNMLYPLPVAMVSCQGGKKLCDKTELLGRPNIITIAWTGTICTNPPMVSISVRPTRYSYRLIEETGEFVINLTTETLVRAADYCGVRSGRDTDKFKEMHLTKEKAEFVSVPLIKESPVSVECRVVEEKNYGSHTMFIGEVLSIDADEKYFDEKGAFDISKCNLIAYANGGYYTLGRKVGKFGYSVEKKRKNKKA